MTRLRFIGNGIATESDHGVIAMAVTPVVICTFGMLMPILGVAGPQRQIDLWTATLEKKRCALSFH